jgi:2-keto-4-pentenoate hydratase/2-oxohepta-3-ene-1,7-dioic acid hydratase in catechol pathway
VPATVFEGEAELALVIGKRARNVPAAEAFDYIFGYLNLIDGSARGLPPRQNAFYQMKSRDTFCPIGPYIVTADEVPDPQNMPVRLWNNGRLMQDFNTSDMAYDIARCVEFISSVHTLEPGDLIATGTNHRGLHPFMHGDRIELQVGNLGRLAVDVRDDLRRTWKRETRHERTLVGAEGTTPQLTGAYSLAEA